MNDALAALQAVDFNWTHALRDIWTDAPFHVDDLNRSTVDIIMHDFARDTAALPSNPVGRVIQGRAGSGKTHLMGTLRRRVWERGGWFVLVDIIGLTDFWQSVALAFVDSLQQRMPNGQPQGRAILLSVLQELFQHPEVRSAVDGIPRDSLNKQKVADIFLNMLSRYDPRSWREHQDVVRALIFLDSAVMEESNFAYMWLQGQNIDEQARTALRFVEANPEPARIVRGLLWFMHIGGPTMIAIDQIDAIVSASNQTRVARAQGAADDAEARKARSLIETLALGLMELHDQKLRAMTVVSCLEVTWPVLTAQAVEPFMDRFSETPTLRPVDDAKVVESLIRGRLSKAYESVGFAPPYPTWPFSAAAIESAVGLRARRILRRCQEFRQKCVAAGRVVECTTLAEPSPPPAPSAPPTSLDALFDREAQGATPQPFGEDETADAQRIVHLCEIYLGHLDLPDSIDGEVKPDANPKAPALHASLSFILHDEGDRQYRWCFRGLEQSHPTAFQARLKTAMTASGIDAALKHRSLTILRYAPPPSGPKSIEIVKAFESAGGRFVAPTEADLRVFAALIAMADRNLPEFETWLRSRKPLFKTSVFAAAGLAPPAFLAQRGAASGEGANQPKPSATPPRPADPAPTWARLEPQRTASARLRLIAERPVAPMPAAAPVAPAESETIPVGRRWAPQGGVGPLVGLAREDLRRHVLIVAGTGGGKTVVLRRLVEEAALAGLPAIVLDINNDLARLGDPWPERPASFSEEDAAKAAAYRDRTDVVVWTPGVASGNPMSLRLLPDFAAIGRARDMETDEEREHAVEMARATLDPFIGATGATGQLRRGVLADALRVFALDGAGTLADFVAGLKELDPEASRIQNATKLAAAIADQLNAAIATNPLLASASPALDIARLFEGSPGKTRISVVNLSGLASDAAKQAFVNQLQMSLFTWVKQHPSATGRLYALDEAQNFAPSTSQTACKRSALALVQQGRKYGLGMIFATQQPKGLDNAIVSNCTTHFYGRVSAPTTITAIKEMMSAKGGAAEDLGALKSGEFYFATEGLSRPVKIRAPLCLSFHPSSPPTQEEVAAIARATRTSSEA